MKEGWIPQGLIPAVLTPMHDDGSLNLLELRNQLERMIACGVQGVFVLGTNGEFYVLSAAEKKQVMQAAVEAVGGRIPVYAGVGCVTTAETVEMAQLGQSVGVDALSVITPYFGQVDQEQLYTHFSTVAHATELPIILYNIPARTGNAIAAETLARLAKVPNIVGIKDSSGNFDQTLQYLEKTNRTFPVLAGNDSLILSTLQAGGAGAISGCANLFPCAMERLYTCFCEGNLRDATRIQDGLRAIRGCLQKGNPNSVIKAAAVALGHPVGPARAPFGIKHQIMDEIRKVLEAEYSQWA